MSFLVYFQGVRYRKEITTIPLDHRPAIGHALFNGNLCVLRIEIQKKFKTKAECGLQHFRSDKTK